MPRRPPCVAFLLRKFLFLGHFGICLLGFGVGGVYGAVEAADTQPPPSSAVFIFSRLGSVLDKDSGFGLHDDDGRNRATS